MMHPAVRAMFFVVAFLLPPTVEATCDAQVATDISNCEGPGDKNCDALEITAKTICEKKAGCMAMKPGSDEKSDCDDTCLLVGPQEKKKCKKSCVAKAAENKAMCECLQKPDSDKKECCKLEAKKTKVICDEVAVHCTALAEKVKTCKKPKACALLTDKAKTLCDNDDACKALEDKGKTCEEDPDCAPLATKAETNCDLDAGCKHRAKLAGICTPAAQKKCGALEGNAKTFCDKNPACKSAAHVQDKTPADCKAADCKSFFDKIKLACEKDCTVLQDCDKNEVCGAKYTQQKKTCVDQAAKAAYEKDKANPNTEIGKAFATQKEIDRKYEQALQEQELQMQVQLLEAMQQQAKVEASALVAKDEDEDVEREAEDEELMARLRLQGLASARKVEGAKRVTTPIVATALAALLGLTLLAVVASRRSHSATHEDSMDSLLKKAELAE